MLTRALLIALFLCAACGSPAPRQTQPDDLVVISIIGTNDVHGQLLPTEGRGGLVTLSGYVNALRNAHAAGGDAVLLLDAGDMWQGTLESNIGEGQAVLEAYEAMGYAAAAIGNHEFDYGQTVLKTRAADASFPFLAANLVYEPGGQPVDWGNVTPSVVLEAGGVRIGVIGVMTEHALYTTKAEHTRGLAVTPLVDAIAREAKRVRENGARLVIVSAHAGSECLEFDNPLDLSSCDMNGEIMQVARSLPPGLVDHIIAGHVHEKIAHVVNGTSITSAASSTRAFGRVDFTIRRSTGEITGREMFPPQLPCPFVSVAERRCAWSAAPGVEPASYEGFPVTPQAEVVAIAESALAKAAERKREPVGVRLDANFTLENNPESALGNLFTQALVESVDGDVALHNVTGGIRTWLPEGELTFGAVYEMFPFDNRVVVLDLTGTELRKIVARQAHNAERRAGFSGMTVDVACAADAMTIEITRDNGTAIGNEDTVRLIVNDFLAAGGDGILVPVMPDGGYDVDANAPMVRDVLLDWLRANGPTLAVADFQSGNRPMWRLPEALSPECRYAP